MMRMEETVYINVDLSKLTEPLRALSRSLDPTKAAADRVLTAATHSAIEQVRDGHDPYWTLLHAGLAAELLIGGTA